MISCLRESSTYRAIIEEGRVDGMRWLLLHQASQKFGPPGSEELLALATITDEKRFVRLALAIFEAANWVDWLAIL